MTNPTERRLVPMLNRVRIAPSARMKFYWQPHFQQHEDDYLEREFGDFRGDEIELLQLALRWGYVREEIVQDNHNDDDAPDGETNFLSLSRLGFEFLENAEGPWYKRALAELTRNALTVFVSVVTAVFIAFVLNKMGF